MNPCLPQPPFTPLPSGQAEPPELSSKLQPGKLSASKPQWWVRARFVGSAPASENKGFYFGERTRIISNVLIKTLK